MRALCRILTIGVLAVLSPGMAYAQASIAGVVRDTSGAVLPGVTVEAASPALIEKVRLAVSDGAGLFRIIDLRPGAYTVTFTLPGFATVRREGIELSGNVVATVNADLRVGGLEETITVTGEAPVVDVTSTVQQAVLGREIVRDIPTVRQQYSVAVLIPGVNVSSTAVGPTDPLTYVNLTIHGSRAGDGKVYVDGISVGQRGTAGNMTMYVMNVGSAQETTVTTAGGLGEAESAAVNINMIPREGGNTVRGSFFGTWANGSMQSSNLDDRLRAAGLAAPNSLKQLWEFTPQVGGPIFQDKLWYFAGGRHQATDQWIAGMFYNKNAGDITKWTYEPDYDRQGFRDGRWTSMSLRLTYQATPRNKFNVFWDEQTRKIGWGGGGTSTTAPEAQGREFGIPNRAFNTTWSSPVTNRVLLEAGWGGTHLRWGYKQRPGLSTDLIQVNEQGGLIPGLTYRGHDWLSSWVEPYQGRASLSYVTGTHTAKVGTTQTWYFWNDHPYQPGAIRYRFRDGVPNQVTLFDTPRIRPSNINSTGLYAQDDWALSPRLTLKGGVRYDYFHSSFPEQRLGFTRFWPQGFMLPPSEGSHVHDISPRLAASYDLFGDGRTAVKVSLGKYMEAQDTWTLGERMNPRFNVGALSVDRSWNDANRNYVPDCDLVNPVANGECGPFSNRNFGTNNPTLTYDEDITRGWGVRPYNWEFTAQVERQLRPGIGLDFSVFRRWFGNFHTTDNRAVVASDFGTFSVTAPADSRLPGGGGYTISGLYDVSEAKFGQINNLRTSTNAFGGGQKEYWTGYDVNLNVRAGGVTVRGGTSIGRRTLDSCALKRQLPELDPSGGSSGETNPWCLQRENFLTQVKWLATYVIPRVDVLVSGTVQSTAGPDIAANLIVTNAQVAPSLGRNLSGGKPNVTVNLIEPGKLQGDRFNQVDLRFAKVLTFGRTRTNVGLDIFNALNSNTPVTYNNTFGPLWLQPRSILAARFFKLSAQIDF